MACPAVGRSSCHAVQACHYDRSSGGLGGFRALSHSIESSHSAGADLEGVGIRGVVWAWLAAAVQCRITYR